MIHDDLFLPLTIGVVLAVLAVQALAKSWAKQDVVDIRSSATQALKKAISGIDHPERFTLLFIALRLKILANETTVLQGYRRYKSELRRKISTDTYKRLRIKDCYGAALAAGVVSDDLYEFWLAMPGDWRLETGVVVCGSPFPFKSEVIDNLNALAAKLEKGQVFLYESDTREGKT